MVWLRIARDNSPTTSRFGPMRAARPPRCDGREGLLSLELASAIIRSSYRDRAVALPLDRGAYSALLAELRQASQVAKG